MAKNNRLNELMSRYIQGLSTKQEEQELASLIMFLKDEDLDGELINQLESFNTKSPLSDIKTDRILSEILSDQKSRKSINFNSRRIYLRVASVAAILIFVFSFGLYLSNLNSARQTMAVAVKAIIIPADKPTNYTRSFRLSDASTVILKAGSTLHYPTSFTGTTREVVLNGEAYFDIAHNKKKPFIIHTGSVKTTVLGTAFDIKAWPAQKNVTVSVTRGRVKVENDTRLLAVLGVNQSVSYNTEATIAKHETVDAGKVVNTWTKQDLVFDHVTFTSIAHVLSKRYGVNIEISDNQVAGTSIVTSFSGTESIQDVLTVLCKITPDCHFKIDQNNVTIEKTSNN